MTRGGTGGADAPAGRGGRAQANLVSLVVALVVVVSATAGAVAIAERSLASADRDDAGAAGSAVADRLVAGDAPTTRRENVLDAAAVRTLDARRLESIAPPAAGRSVSVRVDDRTVVERGDPRGRAATRAVLVAESRTVERRVDLDGGRTLRTNATRVDVRLRLRGGTVVRTVRVDGRPVLHDPDGLPEGRNATVDLDGDATTLRFEGDGTNGTVVVSATRTDAEPATLSVTLGATTNRSAVAHDPRSAGARGGEPA